jgi:recombination protein RecA
MVEKVHEVSAISTGSMSLDISTGIGGFPRGRFTEAYGPEGCLAGNTFIQYEIKTKDGKRQNHKGGTLKNLYERFNKIQRKGTGSYQRLVTSDSLFYVQSVKEDGSIIRNLVADVIYSGVQKTFRITTDSGDVLICTDKHKFLTVGGNYLSLEDGLKVGDVLFVHLNTPYTVEHRIRKYYKEVLVKQHPSGKIKVVNGCKYARVKFSHFIYEAKMNGIAPETYRSLLNSEKDLASLWVVPSGYDIHHKDRNPENNSVDNLELVEKVIHYRMHSMENAKNLSFVVTETKILSINEGGSIDTYDIKCYAPYNNYVANRIVVHNSGKTTLALTAAKGVVEKGGKVLYIDAENMLSYGAIETMLGYAFNEDTFILIQPETAEQAFMVIEAALKSDDFTFIVIDTVAALEPLAEKEKEFDKSTMAEISRMLPKFFRRNGATVREKNVAFLFLNQVRDKVGGYTQGYNSPGGHALKHHTSMIIALTKGETIKVGEKSTGILTKFVIKKNKMSAPFRSYMIPITFGKGIDKFSDAVDFCSMLGVIKKKGSYYKFEEVTIGQGKIAAGDYLEKHPETLDKIEKMVYNVLNNTVSIDIITDEEAEEGEEKDE